MNKGLLRGMPLPTQRVRLWDGSVPNTRVRGRWAGRKQLVLDVDMLTGVGLERFTQVNWTMNAGFPRHRKDYAGTRLEYPAGGGFRALVTAIPSGDWEAILELDEARVVDVTGIVLSTTNTAGTGAQLVTGFYHAPTAGFAHQFASWRYTNFTTYAATQLTPTVSSWGRFIRLASISGTYYATFSRDGLMFGNASGFAHGLGSAPNYIGFCGNNAGAVGSGVGLRSFRILAGGISSPASELGMMRSYFAGEEGL